MNKTTIAAAILLPLLSLARFAGADTPTVTHRVLGQDRSHVAIIGTTGQVDWEAPCPGTAHDITLLPSGNILVQFGARNVVEMTPEKTVAWRWDAQPTPGNTGGVEIHAFQRLKNGDTMIAESGNRRIIEVNRAGKIVREIPLTVENPNTHRDTRMARKLDNGNYLVCHEADATVREYDGKGKVVWSYVLDLNNQPRTPNHDGHGTEVFGAIRLKNGNTLIAGGNNNRVLEVNKQGKIVWTIERDELPGIRLFWVTRLQELPNGNRIIGNTHAGTDNPQLFEVTRDKKVVWSFKDHTNFGDDLAAAQVLDTETKKK
ncbi:MAG: WD40 repeat domain-containing protein [Armatimonadota bacterium]